MGGAGGDHDVGADHAVGAQHADAEIGDVHGPALAAAAPALAPEQLANEDVLAELAQIERVDYVKQANNENLAPVDGLGVYAGNDDILARTLDMPVVVTEEQPERNGATGIGLAPGTPVLTKPTFGLAGTPEILHAVRDTGRTTAVLVGHGNGDESVWCTVTVAVDTSALQRADRHLGGRLLADRAESQQRLRVDAEHRALGVIGIGDEAAVDHVG